MKKILFLVLLLVCRSLISEAQPNTDLRFNSGKGISWNQGSKLFSIDGSAELRGNVLNFRTLSDAVKFTVDGSGNVNITGEYRINGVPISTSGSIDTNRFFLKGWKEVNDADYMIGSYDHTVVIKTISNPRTFTLPLANSVIPGTQIVIRDLSGDLQKTNYILVSRSGSDLINMEVSDSLFSPYGVRRYQSDGVNNWSYDGGAVRIGRDNNFLGGNSFKSVYIENLKMLNKITTNYLSDSLYKKSNLDTGNIFYKNKRNVISGGLIDFNSGFDDTIRKVDGGAFVFISNTLSASLKLSTAGQLLGYVGATNYWSIDRWGACFFAGGVTQNGKLVFQNYLYQTQLEGGNRKTDSASWQSGTVGNLYFNKNGTFNKSIYVKETSSGNTGWSAIKTNSADVSPGTTGTVSIPMTRSVYTLTPTGNMTLNATNGQAGNTCIIYITTSGTTDYRITFGTNFVTTDVLDVGIISGKVYTIMFVCKDGSTWAEVSRTTAM